MGNNKTNYKTGEETYRKEIHDYLERFKNSSPEEILQYLEEMREFLYNNMTEEGRKIFEQLRKSKLEGSI